MILKDVQRAPVSGEILHADLYEVDLKRAIRVEVPFKFTGKARASPTAESCAARAHRYTWNACRWKFPT